MGDWPKKLSPTTHNHLSSTVPPLDPTKGTVEVIPASLARELYEALKDAHVEAENERLPGLRRIDDWATTLARYEREVETVAPDSRDERS